MTEKLHSPPGFVNDLTEENKRKWSKIVSEEFMLTDRVNPTVTPQFYDVTKVDDESEVDTAVITWIAFPKQVKLQNPNDDRRWEVADGSRDVQDEYLEWSVKRNNEGKIVKIVFANEGPEYFEFLADHQPETLLALYQDLHPEVTIQSEDLYIRDWSGKLVYNGRNKWNNSTTTGTIMHLIQRNNTLGAEVDLGAQATIVRKRPNGTIITDEQELIQCSRYGNKDRHSDPHIGISCNNLVRQLPRRLTIKEPIGLYIDHVNWGSVTPPPGHEDDDPSTFWTWTRGSPGNYMRGEFEVPEEKGYVVGDILVNGRPMKYASQLADYISISITGKTSAWNGTADPELCPSIKAANVQYAAVAMSSESGVTATSPKKISTRA